MRIIAVIKYALGSSSRQLPCGKYGSAGAGRVTVPEGERGHECGAGSAGASWATQVSAVGALWGTPRHIPWARGGCDGRRAGEGPLCNGGPYAAVLQVTVRSAVSLLHVCSQPLILPASFSHGHSVSVALWHRVSCPKCPILPRKHLPHVSHCSFPAFHLSWGCGTPGTLSGLAADAPGISSMAKVTLRGRDLAAWCGWGCEPSFLGACHLA